MTFLYPGFLWLLIPLILLFLKATASIRFKTHLVILMLLTLTLTRPVQEKTVQKTDLQAKDIVIALDVSFSMQAGDLRPNRYSFATETIKILLQQNPTDNMMLIAFTSNPLLLSPPTTDHALIAMALDTLNPKFILTKGTSLKRLFTKLSTLHAGHKILILMTDGGEEQEVTPLINLLKSSDISLITLALGTTQGTTIPTSGGTLLKDKGGNLIISQINPMLQRLTTALNGVYLKGYKTPKKTAYSLYEALQNQETPTQYIKKMQHRHLELYPLPLLMAILLFLLLHTRGVKYLILLFALLGFQAEASIWDGYYLHQAYSAYEKCDFKQSQTVLKKISMPSLQSQIALAHTYYKQHAFKASIRVYSSILSTSVPIKQMLYYNIATAYAQLGAYAKAKTYYIKALQLGADNDTIHNLKLIMRLEEKEASPLGIARPKSQNDTSSKSDTQKENKEKTEEENQPSSGAGNTGENHAKQENKKQTHLREDSPQKHPLSSKVYELINKGYIHETHPW